MNTPLQTPLQELIEIVAECGNDSLRTRGWFVDKCNTLLQKESQRTEEIAIGFSKWKWENGWRITYLEKEKGLCYENLSDWPVFKTDRELFKDYMESLKP